jgi:hypothetical protein
MDDVQRKLLHRIYVTQCTLDRLAGGDEELKSALERDIVHALIALRLWRSALASEDQEVPAARDIQRRLYPDVNLRRRKD